MTHHRRGSCRGPPTPSSTRCGGTDTDSTRKPTPELDERSTTPMGNDPWYDSTNPTTVARGATWRFGLWLLACLLAVAVVGGLVWGFKVITSDAKGQGDAIRTVNAGDNRLAQQAYFEQTHEDIKQADRQLDQLAADKAAKVDGADIRFTGGVTYCQGLVRDYNAAARKQIAERFRSADLPFQIDDTNPLTDCATNGATTR